MSESQDESSPRGLARWLAPSFLALVFCLNPAAILLNPDMPLRDPGIGWHLITGRLILESGAPVMQDVFSFTQPGKAFVGGAWLFQATAAWLEKMGGLPLLTVACGLWYALVPVILYRRMLAERVPAPIALGLGGLAFGVLMVHSLNRPHIVSYVLFAALLSSLAALRRGAPCRWHIFVHVPLMVIWCNCHRGFVIGLLLAGVFAAAAIGERLVGQSNDGSRARIFAALLVGMALASLVNPWGWGLHFSTAEYLKMESIRYWNEYRSPDFLGGGSAVVAFELMIFATIAAMAWRARRFDWLEILLVLLFLHWGLQSFRHANLFAIVAAPPIARGFWDLCQRLPGLARRCTEMDRMQSLLFGGWPQIIFISAALAALAFKGENLFRRDLDGLWLSRGAAEYIGKNLGRCARPFNTDELGGSLIYRFWPRLRVFVDDRNELYGDEFILGDYFEVRDGRKNWRKVLDRFGVDSAVVNSGSAQDSLFASSAEWSEGYRDNQNVVFFRSARTGAEPGISQPDGCEISGLRRQPGLPRRR